IYFIYINGSNNNNAKMHDWFLNGIKKFHPELKKQLEKNCYTYEYMLKNGEYNILPKPSNFFWGYKSKQDLMFMKEKAGLLRSISPVIAYFVRNTIADIMHDAIWVQKSKNMIPLVEELDSQVKEDYKKGNKVVLLGYSAGSFISLEYLFTKMPYINIAEFFEKENLDKDLTEMIEKNQRKDTCLMAFVGSNLTNANPLGQITVNTNREEFKEAYMNMDEFTDKYCVPDDTVIGVINYASPIPLFYSDMADKKFGTFKFMHLMYNYLIEHDFFFLTVNYADDPLGFPNGVNYTNEEIKNLTNMEFEQELGFFYDYSRALSWRTFAGAHTSYWATKKHFSKSIVKAYKEGRELQYGEN
ncbi:hypothetical protein IJ707_02460, partial [bacterium]|nr:hypothetical protein [bacterium]